MGKFTPIAMRCSQEQFYEIKPKLERIGKIHNLTEAFTAYEYLTNNYGGKLIFDFVKGDNEWFQEHKGNIHRVWDEEIFLESCGAEAELLNNKNMVDLMGYSVLVDNKEQARKLQEIAIEQGFKWEYSDEKIKYLGEESFQFGYNGKKVITYNYGGNHYQDNFITKKAHFNDLFKEETLQEKEQRLLKELEEVRKEIEDSKVKVGDWCKFWDSDESRFIIGKLERVYEAKNYPYFVHSKSFKNCMKITDSTLLGSLNRLFKN